MKFIGNILWLLLGGIIISFYYAVMGLLFCITIIGIPFGLQLFKIAGLALWPFGREVVAGPNDTGCLAVIMNIIWIIFGGIEIALLHLGFGIACCLTIIGIPFGMQLFKMAGLALWPFGHDVTPGANDGGCLSLIMNVIWIVLGGIEIALMHVTLGIGFCITIVGIPFGLQHFKMALLALVPFGKEIS